MNIFFLSLIPSIAAKWHCDRHVVKMVLESVQILYVVHWLTRSDDTEWIKSAPLNGSGNHGYKKTHVKHPSVLWALESKTNYNWLLDLGFALHDEFRLRYGKDHSVLPHLHWLKVTEPLIHVEEDVFTPPKLAMPQECKDYAEKNKLDASGAYQYYYINNKLGFISYRNLEIPPFLTDHFSDEENYTRLGLKNPLSRNLLRSYWIKEELSKETKESYGIDNDKKQKTIINAVATQLQAPKMWNDIIRNGPRISNAIQKCLQLPSKIEYQTPFDKSRKKRKLPELDSISPPKKQKTSLQSE